MSEKWTFNFGSSTLIQLMKARPCLWDHGCSNYKVRQNKEEAWREIYCDMVPDFESLSVQEQNDLGNQITRRWYNIRDAYVKWLRGGKYRRSRPYLYHEQLEFYKKARFNDSDSLEITLQETTEDEMAVGTIEALDFSQDCKDILERQEENPLENEDELSDPLPESSALDSKKRRPSSSADPMAELLLKLLKRNDDEDEAFFSSILPDVRAMSGGVKRKFRIEVLSLIKRLLRKKRRKIRNSETDDDSD